MQEWQKREAQIQEEERYGRPSWWIRWKYLWVFLLVLAGVNFMTSFYVAHQIDLHCPAFTDCGRTRVAVMQLILPMLMVLFATISFVAFRRGR